MRVAVIGSGPAGSYAAYLSHKKGHTVEVYEKAADIGGRTLSYRKNGFTHDTGAAFLTNFYKRVFMLAPELGLKDALLQLDSVSALSRDGEIAKLDLTSISSFVRFPFLSLKEKLRLSLWVAGNTLRRSRYDLSDPSTLMKDDIEDVMTFGKRVLGDKTTEVILRSAVEPFWFFRSDQTSIALTKALSAHAAGSSLYVLKGGIDQLCTRLLRGLTVKLNTEVNAVKIADGKVDISFEGETQQYDKVIIATTASQAQKLISEDISGLYPAALLDFIRTQEYSANVHATFKIPIATEISEARSVIPCHSGDRIIGDVSFHRDKLTGEEADGQELCSVSLTDAQSRKMMHLSDSDCFEEAWKLAKNFVDFLPEQAEPFHLARRLEAIPMQTPGQYRRAVGAQEAQQNARLPVRFCGDYFTLPWIEGALASAESALFDL